MELSRIFPALSTESFDVRWNGSVDMSLDETPAVGWMGKHGNIFYAIGFSGHGVNLTSVFGQILADPNPREKCGLAVATISKSFAAVHAK